MAYGMARAPEELRPTLMMLGDFAVLTELFLNPPGLRVGWYSEGNEGLPDTNFFFGLGGHDAPLTDNETRPPLFI